MISIQNKLKKRNNKKTFKSIKTRGKIDNRPHRGMNIQYICFHF